MGRRGIDATGVSPIKSAALGLVSLRKLTLGLFRLDQSLGSLPLPAAVPLDDAVRFAVQFDVPLAF
ncbi:hypothetical protein SAMN05444158_2167 [Bradyrhizobium canariense]|uniref:Uncharacterized protein n=1 Tax=Bradyrhizobium canariense TaxID=255045 RepID=A0A1H1SHF4_9BRAD|nr:hypothetical protein SAMN05444158_2167 [Bradyrhizobium canariense]